MLIKKGFPILQPEPFSKDARRGVEAAGTKQRLPGAARAAAARTGPFASREVDPLDRLHKCLSANGWKATQTGANDPEGVLGLVSPVGGTWGSLDACVQLR